IFADHGHPYRVGVYGAGSICDELLRRNFAQHFWIAGFSTGWSGAAKFYNRHSWNLFQNALELPVGRIRVDTNILNIAAPNMGCFNQSGEVDPVIDNDTVFRAQMFLNRDEKLRKSPNGEAIITVRKGKMVTKISASGDFTVIDAAF